MTCVACMTLFIIFILFYFIISFINHISWLFGHEEMGYHLLGMRITRILEKGKFPFKKKTNVLKIGPDWPVTFPVQSGHLDWIGIKPGLDRLNRLSNW